MVHSINTKSLENHKYKWGIFYYDLDDKRVLVPKQNPMMGWTFNFAKPLTYLFFLVFFLVVFAALYFGW